MKRPVDGILLLNKPLHISSNSALQKAKRLVGAQKAGHTGSLDLLATGMLPICFGQATKFAQFFIDDDIGYTVVAQFGTATDSGDTAGKVVQQADVPVFSQDRLQSVIDGFLGPQTQIPPMFSAVKIDGKRLYKHARKGREIERPARNINIKKLTLIQYCPLKHELALEVTCSKGTYIRTLVEDLAKALGTCGHVTSLHRNFVGKFEESACVSLDDLANMDQDEMDARMLPIQAALPAWPKIELSDLHTLHFKQGRIIDLPVNPQDWIQVYSELGDFVGLGVSLEPNKLKPKKLLCTKHIQNLAVSQ